MLGFSTKTFRNLSIVFCGSSLARGAAFINSVIIARNYSQADFGKYSIFYVVMVLIWQFSQSLDITFIRHSSASDLAHDKQEYLKSLLALKIIYVILVSFVFVALLMTDAFSAELGHCLLYSLITGLSMVFVVSVGAFYQEQESFLRFILSNSFLSLAMLIVMSTIWLFNLKVPLESVLAGFALFASFFGMLSIYRIGSIAGNIFSANRVYLIKTLSFGKWIVLSTFFYFLFQRLDYYFMSHFYSLKEVGAYSAAAQLCMAVSLLTGTVSSVFLTKASRALESPEKFRIYLREAFGASVLMVACVLLVFMSAPLLMTASFGSQYADSVDALRYLLVGWMFLAFYIPFSHLYLTLNKPNILLMLEIIKFSGAMALMSFMTFQFGSSGIPIAVSISLVVYVLVSLLVLAKQIKSTGFELYG